MNQKYIETLAQTIKRNYPKRHTLSEKNAFRKYIIAELQQLGWTAHEMDGNIVTECQTPKTILTAHFDTGNRITYISLLYKLFNQSLYTVLIPLGLLVSYFIYGLIVGGLNYILSYILLLTFLPVVIGSFFPNPINMNDNSSGIITLLGIAQSIKPNENIQLVFFDEEENGLKGSKRFKEHLKQNINNYQKIAILNFDCVGVGNTLILSTLNTPSSNTLGEKLRKILLTHQGPFTVLVKKKFSNSDYRIFNESPAIGFSVTRSSKYWGYHMPNMHTPKDKVLNLSGMAWLISNISVILTQSEAS